MHIDLDKLLKHNSVTPKPERKVIFSRIPLLFRPFGVTFQPRFGRDEICPESNSITPWNPCPTRLHYFSVKKALQSKVTKQTDQVTLPPFSLSNKQKQMVVQNNSLIESQDFTKQRQKIKRKKCDFLWKNILLGVTGAVIWCCFKTFLQTKLGCCHRPNRVKYLSLNGNVSNPIPPFWGVALFNCQKKKRHLTNRQILTAKSHRFCGWRIGFPIVSQKKLKDLKLKKSLITQFSLVGWKNSRVFSMTQLESS